MLANPGHLFRLSQSGNFYLYTHLQVAYSLEDKRGLVVISIRGKMDGKESFCCDVHKLIAITGDGSFVISQKISLRPFENNGLLSYGRVGLSIRVPDDYQHVRATIHL